MSQQSSPPVENALITEQLAQASETESVKSRASSHASSHSHQIMDFVEIPIETRMKARTPSISPPVPAPATGTLANEENQNDISSERPPATSVLDSRASKSVEVGAEIEVGLKAQVDTETEMIIDPSLMDGPITAKPNCNDTENEAVPETAKILPQVQAQIGAGTGTEWQPHFGDESHLNIENQNESGWPSGSLQGQGKPTTPWSLQTSFAAALPGIGSNDSHGGDTQPPSTVTESPSMLWETSTATSGMTTDYDSYPSNMKRGGSFRHASGLSYSTTSSESGWGENNSSRVPTEFGDGDGDDYKDGGEGGGTDADGEGEGIPPPPRAKKSHARKQPEGHIKRARNAFILFRKHITDSNLIPPSVEVKHQNISVVAAKMWKEAPQEVRAKFQEEARIEKEEHQRKYPGYRYQPVFRRTDIIRRRVRKDPAEDEKVDAVADALIKGKAGENLEKEIKDQLVSRSEASESEAESSTRGSRRRRRETGQLSKGALRAQRAQARAKQMRQNLLGTNLLNMSLYNAAQSRLASSGYSTNPHAHAHMHGHGHGHPGMQYAMSENYLPVGYDGYDMQGRPIPRMPYQGQGGVSEMYAHHLHAPGMIPGQEMGAEMYRLPPIDGMSMSMETGAGVAGQGGYDWQAQGGQQGGGGEYWDATAGVFRSDPGGLAPYGSVSETGMQMQMQLHNGAGAGEYYTPGPSDMGVDVGAGAGGGAGGYDFGESMPSDADGMEYRLPPLLEASREGDRSQQSDISMGMGGGGGHEDGTRDGEWARESQQTPSGHVPFSERLFDGALGSAMLPDRREDDGLGLGLGMGMGLFDQELQSTEVPPW